MRRDTKGSKVKMRSMRKLGLALAIVLGAGPALAAQGTVEGTGEAQIKGGDKVAAKKAAIADALRRCIEKVVGISMQSDFSSEQKEAVKNDQSKFEQTVSDKIVQKAEGFIEKYEELNEAESAGILKMTVRATVFESKLKKEVQDLADLFIKCGKPKIMIVIQDIMVSPEGK